MTRAGAAVGIAFAIAAAIFIEEPAPSFQPIVEITPSYDGDRLTCSEQFWQSTCRAVGQYVLPDTFVLHTHEIMTYTEVSDKTLEPDEDNKARAAGKRLCDDVLIPAYKTMMDRGLHAYTVEQAKFTANAFYECRFLNQQLELIENDRV